MTTIRMVMMATKRGCIKEKEMTKREEKGKW
jgi:hypothetical protein